MADTGDIVKFVASFEATGIEGVRAHVDGLRQAAEQARDRTREMQGALGSGEMARSIRDAERYRRELTRLGEQQKKMVYQARLGRVGGAVAYYGSLVANSAAARVTARAVGGGAVAGAAAVTGAARSGFSNTVEMNAFNLQLQLASRELAGAFVPALRIATGVVSSVRARLERMTRQEQAQLSLGAMAVGGTVAASLLSRSVFGVGLGGLVTGAARLGGTAAAAGVGAGAGGATGVSAGTAAVAGGLGARALTAVGRLGTIGAGVQAAMDAREEFLRLTSTGPTVRNVAHLAARSVDFLPFGRQIRGQLDKAMAGAGFAGGIAPGKPGSGRDTVTPADAGFEAPGSGFERVATALALVDAAKGKEPKKDILEQIYDLLKEALGSPDPPPRK